MGETIIFTVKFEDGKKIKMTTEQVNKLTKEKRRYVVFDSRGKPIFKKIFRG